jgi:preprotein translocase subunit SecD
MVCREKRGKMKLTFRIWILIIVLLISLLAIKPSFESGIVVKSVDQGSQVFESGLRAGEKIIFVNGNPIEKKADYANAINSIFIDEEEKRLTITTEENEYIFLTNETPRLTIDDISRTRIQTGLDLRGGARALIKPDVEITDSQLQDLVDISRNRFNVYGLSDVSIKGVSDLSGNKFMLVEVAGATPDDLEQLISKQGKFEAIIANQTVFEGGERDISDVCRNDASCATVTNCYPIQGGEACDFQFSIYLKEEAAQRHADVTRNLSLDDSGRYLNERLYLFVDDIEADSLLISSGLRGQLTTQISIQGSGSGTTRDEAIAVAREQMNELQTILLTGSLPYKLEIEKLDTISPTLGKDFISLIFTAVIAAILSVSVIVFIRYRKVKASLALLFTSFSELFIILGVAALIRWNLDLPSIAGILVTIGTGIDQQIIILDEAAHGLNLSIKERMKRAFSVIIVAYLTLIAAMLPLYWAGAGLFKGFALTTIIGVTAGVLITRPAFADIIKKIEEA